MPPILILAAADPSDEIQALRKLPAVHSVEISVPSKEPKATIIHLLNWHYVPKKSFAVDLRNTAKKPISDEEIDKQYEEFLIEVEHPERPDSHPAPPDSASRPAMRLPGRSRPEGS